MNEPALIPAIAAVIGLFFMGFSLKSDRQTRELQLTEGIIRDLRQLEREFYDNYEKKDEYERGKWDRLFFNTVEWFALLINNKKIKDKTLTDFFGPAIIRWYEGIFEKHGDKKIIEDDSKYEEFKKLYKKFKKELKKSKMSLP